MKKLLMMMAVLFCGAMLVSAQGQEKAGAPAAQPEKKPLDQWTLFQLGFFPNFPEGTKNSNVYGLKLGAPMVSGYGRVYGIEPSLLYSGTDYINGIQATWVGPSICKETYGIQAAWFGPTIAKTVYGIQASCMVNVADEVIGFDPGLVCITKNIVGFQASAVNVSNTVTGFQASAVNVAREELTGVQLGAVNYSKKNGCQFGLINIIEGGILPFTIIFNCKF